jgi:hypothetical protein
MNMTKNALMAALALAGALSWRSQALGADQEKPAAGQGQAQWRQRLQAGRAQGGGNFDVEQFRAVMSDRLKTMLRSSDEEWKVIQPLVEDVILKQGAAMRGQLGGMLGAWGMVFGRGGNAGAQPEGLQSPQRSAGAAEVLALRQVVEAENAPVSEIKAKLADYREARKKTETALRDAREKLRAVLGHRQEAQLVLLGILD